jgi:hypothetical protein
MSTPAAVRLPGPLRVGVSGAHIFVYVGQAEVYQYEPEGEAWTPGLVPGAAFSWYDLGQEAVIIAASSITYFRWWDVLQPAAYQIAAMTDRDIILPHPPRSRGEARQ